MDRQDCGYGFSRGGGPRSDIYFRNDLPASEFPGFGRGKCRDVFAYGSAWNARISAGFRHFSYLFLLIYFCENYTKFKGIFKQPAEIAFGNK